MLDISLEELKSILGEPTSVRGHQYFFRCPSCAASGGDRHGDNLLYNERKRVLKCFACDDGAAQVLQMINQYRKEHNIQIDRRDDAPIVESKQWWQVNQDNLLLYLEQTVDELKPYVQQWLLKKHGITSRVMEECGIGYDGSPSMVRMGSSITFPMWSVKHSTLVGFELRQVGDEKVIKHTPQAPSCLCCVHRWPWAKRLIICEGFKDAYNLLEMMWDRKDEVNIYTPANGVGDIFHNIQTLPLGDFDKFYLLLDNDNAGDKATQKIIEKYPFFVDMRGILKGCKDVSEYRMSKCN